MEIDYKIGSEKTVEWDKTKVKAELYEHTSKGNITRMHTITKVYTKKEYEEEKYKELIEGISIDDNYYWGWVFNVIL